MLHHVSPTGHERKTPQNPHLVTWRKTLVQASKISGNRENPHNSPTISVAKKNAHDLGYLLPFVEYRLTVTAIPRPPKAERH